MMEQVSEQFAGFLERNGLVVESIPARSSAVDVAIAVACQQVQGVYHLFPIDAMRLSVVVKVARYLLGACEQGFDIFGLAHRIRMTDWMTDWRLHRLHHRLHHRLRRYA